MNKFRLRGVILHTDKGTRMISFNSRGKIWTKEDCFRYCNSGIDAYNNKLRSNNLTIKAAIINIEEIAEYEWYKNKNNFKDFDGQILEK